MTMASTEQAQARAAKRLIESVGGLEAASAYTGKSTSQLSRYCLRHRPDSMPVSVVQALEDVTHGQAGHPVMTRHLATAIGYALVQLPDPMAPPTCWSEFVSRLAKEGGDIMSGICADLADDNDVSPAEAKARLTDADELVDISVQIRKALKERAREAS